MKKQWRFLEPDSGYVQQLSARLGCTPITAMVLANRHITAAEAADKFLHASLQDLRLPCVLQDMDAAVERIDHALRRRERILVFGDYDVDGITATTILYEFLKTAGAEVAYYIPHRLVEGYGLQVRHITRRAAPKGIDLIITADCGSSSGPALEAARQAGIDVIITDHHNLADSIPAATALVNPKRADCRAGFAHLAGVGVAMALIICLRKHLREKSHWTNRPEPNLKDMCDLVALGTVADAVPMVEENRLFCKAGLEVIRSGRHRPGLQELINSCQSSHQTIDAKDIAFKLAPRLNAAGRLAHARLAVALLETKNRDRARRIARRLNILNAHRKNIEKEIIADIRTYLRNHPDELARRSLVLARTHWHEGVLGIVASRLVEKYGRPVVLISMRGGIGKGSARSIPGFDLYAGLTTCGDHLEKFGGHAMAAGLQIQASRIDAFKADLERTVQQTPLAQDWVPEILIDARIDFREISERLADEIEALKPFGPGNTEPLLVASDVTVKQSQIVGAHHRRMVLQQRSDGGNRFLNAIQFQVDPNRPLPMVFQELAFRIKWNHWNGRRQLQAIVEDYITKD